MKNIKIRIDSGTVFSEVEKTTVYTGARNPSENGVADADRYRRVAADSADRTMLGRYWLEAASAMLERLKGFMASASLGPEALEMSMSVSGSYDDTLTAGVEQSLLSYMVSAVAARWFRIALPGASGEYEADSQRHLSEAERQLYHRRAPRRGRRG